MSRLYKKFKLDQLKLAAKKKNENDLLRKAGCLGERPSEEPDPVFRILTDKLNNLADRITTEIAQESAGDPVKTLRCEWAFFWQPHRTELEKTLDQAESASLSISFRKNPPTARERALSAADRFIDQALFDVNIFGNPSYATEDYANAKYYLGVFLGLNQRDSPTNPEEVFIDNEYLGSKAAKVLATRRHAAKNRYRELVETEYLEKIESFDSKTAATDYLHGQFDLVTYSTIWSWLSALPLPPNPKRKPNIEH